MNSNITSSRTGDAGMASSHGSASARSRGSRESRGSSLATGGAESGRFLCVFALGGRTYALDVAYVAEVIAIESVTSVPLVPHEIIGMHNLRGSALAIVDLANVLEIGGVSERGRTGLTAIVVSLAGKRVGAKVDRVLAVYPFEKDKLKETAAQAEHPAVMGLIEFSARSGLVATLLDGEDLARRLEAIQSERNKAPVAATTA